MRTTAFVVTIAVALALTVVVTGTPQQRASRSSAAAVTLVKLMTDRGLEAAAARDPREPGRFVAALCFPGTQLLVVSAKYPVPAALEQRLSNHEYRDVYMDLQGDVTREGRFFVQDMQTNGLQARPERGAAVDIVYENGAHGTTFDGNGKGTRLSQDDYDARFEAADRRYTEVLAALVAGLQGSR
jgi:hypothetical protein